MAKLTFRDIKRNDKITRDMMVKIFGGSHVFNLYGACGSKKFASIIENNENQGLIAFQGGDHRAPVVVGNLWSGQDTPPDRSDT